ncbi:MAG: hypothetical protein RL365_495 [Bacteroidota bacterium]|jgi:hypothetical protein
MIKKSFLIVFIFIPLLSICQNSEDKFYVIAEKIEGLLKYRDKSPAQLRELLVELEKHSEGNESSYELLKNRCDGYIMPIEIKLVRSDLFNMNFKGAIVKTRTLKTYYPFKEDINNLEAYVDRKIYRNERKEFLRPKSTILSLEPSIGLFSQEVSTKALNSLSNFYPIYGLAFYAKIGIKSKVSYSSKPKFSYSQVGLKLEYRDTNYRLIPNDSIVQASPFLNTQLSFLIRKCIGLDIGVLSYSSSTLHTHYSFSASFFIPMGYFSLGFNSRLLTDFKAPVPLIQFGATLKFNLGLYRPYLMRDKEEVKTRVIKFKESI